MSTIPEPDFIVRDPEVIEQQVLATWEQFGGAALEAGQVELLFLKTIAYREALVRIGVQEAAKQNLLRYAQFPMVDYLGELLGAPRLGEAPALTTLRWALSGPHGAAVTIEAGTRARTKDGRFTFATLAVAVVAIGQTYVDIAAQCTVAGPDANGYLPGQVVEIIDSVPAQVVGVTNLTVTRDGSGAESSANYVERLLVAPEAVSTAGSEETYRYHARTVSSAVSDCVVLSPEPGAIRIPVLSTAGTPSPELLALVQAAVTPEEVRPLTDTVTVVAAEAVTWTLTAALTLFANVDADSVLAAATAAATAFTAVRRAKLHRSAMRTQLISALSVPGVFSVNLVSPAADVLASEDEWLDCQGINVTLAGYTAEVLEDE